MVPRRVWSWLLLFLLFHVTAEPRSVRGVIATDRRHRRRCPLPPCSVLSAISQTLAQRHRSRQPRSGTIQTWRELGIVADCGPRAQDGLLGQHRNQLMTVSCTLCFSLVEEDLHDLWREAEVTGRRIIMDALRPLHT